MTANRVRIIAGKWRSRLVRFPPVAALRPTPDRVRETLFNWLGQRLDDLVCLDLFAGSGALGFECDRAVAKALRESARVLDAAADVVESDALAYVRKTAERFDVVFLDPPFASDLAARALAALPRCLAPQARVYVESGERLEPGAPFELLREDRAGAVRYALYAYKP